MSPKNLRWILLIAPLVMGGCLLPQPDTPIIPPPGAVMTGPGMAPENPQTGLPSHETQKGTTTDASATALISGRIQGEGVTGITAVPVSDAGLEVHADMGDAGIFDLTLAPGEYHLDLTVEGAIVRATPTITVQAGETRTFEVKVTPDPAAATLSETTTPVESPPATPETSATP